MKFDREILKGFLKVIILAVLQDDPCHAYGLRKRVEEKSLKVFTLSEGTIYPTLHKLEDAGLIESKWEKREKRPDVRIYTITPKGLKHLRMKDEEWHYFSKAMDMVLKIN